MVYVYIPLDEQTMFKSLLSSKPWKGIIVYFMYISYIYFNHANRNTCILMKNSYIFFLLSNPNSATNYIWILF